MTKFDEIPLINEPNVRMFNNVIREDLLRGTITLPAAGAESNCERLEIIGNDRPAFLSFNRSELFEQAMPS